MSSAHPLPFTPYQTASFPDKEATLTTGSKGQVALSFVDSSRGYDRILIIPGDVEGALVRIEKDGVTLLSGHTSNPGFLQQLIDDPRFDFRSAGKVQPDGKQAHNALYLARSQTTLDIPRAVWDPITITDIAMNTTQFTSYQISIGGQITDITHAPAAASPAPIPPNDTDALLAALARAVERGLLPPVPPLTLLFETSNQEAQASTPQGVALTDL